MMGSSRQGLPSWIGLATATRKVEIDKNVANEESFDKASSNSRKISDAKLSFRERAFSAAGAAFISAVIVNPLDVAKIRLQAQAAGVPYDALCQTTCSGASSRLQGRNSIASSVGVAVGNQPACSPDCTRYRGTLDVIYKVIRQEGFSRLWRGTNASLALAVPSVGIYMPLYDIFRNYMEAITSQNAPTLTAYVPLVAGSAARSIACITCYPIELARTRMQAFQHKQADLKPPGVWRTLIGVISSVRTVNNKNQTFQSFRILWTGLGAQLSRDVPFSAVCWSSLEPLRRKILSSLDDEATASSVLGTNFCAGYVAGSLAAATTCPLDVARTRRQIEDPTRALKMTTRQTLMEIWGDGGIRGLFAGAGPRVARAGPSVGIVVSFYEVVKYVLHYIQSSNLRSD